LKEHRDRHTDRQTESTTKNNRLLGLGAESIYSMQLREYSFLSCTCNMQGVTVDEARVNSIKSLADKLIEQGRTDTKFIKDKRDSLDSKYVNMILLFMLELVIYQYI